MLIDIETRKLHTQQIIHLISKYLNIFTNNNNNLSAYLLFFFHLVICGIPLLYILFGSINKIFYFCLLIWLCIVILHFYFGGCIITKTERYLFNNNNNKWYGIWNILFIPLNKMGVEITKNMSSNIYICSGIILFLFIFLKLLLY